MALPRLTSKGMIGGLLAAVSLLAAVVWAVVAREPRRETQSLLPDALSVEALKAKAANPSELRETLRSQQLTDEQRRELRSNMREMMRAQMQSRIGEYFTTAEEDKQAVLDRHLDEFQKRMREWERERAEKSWNEEQMRREFRDRFQNQSREERKADSESRNPDQTAQTMAYLAALRDRAQERGLSFPGRGFGPPRRGGGARGSGPSGRRP